MTKKEWKGKLIELFLSEPETHGAKYLNKKQMADYIQRLEVQSDPYYGTAYEIVIAIEKHLGL